jgi:hypothetical protein
MHMSSKRIWSITYPCEEIMRVNDTSSQYADVCINEAGSHLLNAMRGFEFGCADAVCR